MSGRFYILGGIVSLALHGAFFALLAFCSEDEKRPEQQSVSRPPVVTNETVSAKSPALSPERPPDRSGDLSAESTPVRSKYRTRSRSEQLSPPVAKPVAASKPVAATNPIAAPKSTAAPKSAEPKPSVVSSAAEKAPREWKLHTVKSGETLSKLARKSGCTCSEIAKRNKMHDKQMEKLKVGQRILLPVE